MHKENIVRVWKSIPGIQDLTKIRCGIRENAKYLDRTRDLITPREARLAKIWLRDAGICCLYVGNSGKRHDPNKRSSGESESTRRVAYV